MVPWVRVPKGSVAKTAFRNAPADPEAVPAPDGVADDDGEYDRDRYSADEWMEFSAAEWMAWERGGDAADWQDEITAEEWLEQNPDDAEGEYDEDMLQGEEEDHVSVTDEEEEVTSPLAALGPMEPPKGPSDKARLLGFLKAKKAQAPPDCVPERPQITRELAPWAVSVKPAGKQTASEKAHLAQNSRQQRRPGRAWIDPTTGEKLWTDHESGETFANHGCD